MRGDRRLSRVDAYFTTDANDELPATVAVSYWNGTDWVPVTGQHVSFAGTSDAPSTIMFDPVTATALRLDMTSRSPGDPTTGNLMIAELTFPGSG